MHNVGADGESADDWGAKKVIPRDLLHGTQKSRCQTLTCPMIRGDPSQVVKKEDKGVRSIS